MVNGLEKVTDEEMIKHFLRVGINIKKMKEVEPVKEYYSRVDFGMGKNYVLHLRRLGPYRKSQEKFRRVIGTRADTEDSGGVPGEQRLGMKVIYPRKQSLGQLGSYNLRFIGKAYEVLDFEMLEKSLI